MNTTSDGSPNPTEETRRRGLPLGVVLVAAAAAVLFAILVGPRLVGLLFAIVSPPVPPLPDNIIQVSYEELAYGVDRWTYSTDGDICDLVTFYKSHEGECPVLPPSCQTGMPVVDPDLLGQCYGAIEFASFMMRWQLEIPHRAGNSPGLRFELSRQISWTGDMPSETP